MPRTDLTATTPDGECAVSLHTPDGEGPWPGVIVFPDAGGARDAIREIADRIAAMGYAAAVPDVYYRAAGEPPFDFATVFSDEAERNRLFKMIGTLTNDRIDADAGALLDLLASRPEVAGTKVGTTGYCMGGRISMLVAGQHPDRIGAAASFHGGRIAVEGDPTSPHLLADRVQATVYVGGAKEDGSFTAEQAELLEQALSDAGVAHTIETYDALHGFAVSDNPTYDKAATERHDEALRALYGSALGG